MEEEKDEKQPEETPGIPEQSAPGKKKLSARAKILIVLGSVLAAIGVLALAIALIEGREKQEEFDYTFYPVVDENIFEDEDYLGLNRNVFYANGGVTQEIKDDNEDEFPEEIRFLNRLIEAVRAGDNTAYRSMLNRNYVKEFGTPEPFTQQRLYNITVSPYSTEAQKDGSKLLTYRLDYMIRKNNGTYRKDVGSDAIRPQYVVLRQKDGELSVERIVSYRQTKAKSLGE